MRSTFAAALSVALAVTVFGCAPGQDGEAPEPTEPTEPTSPATETPTTSPTPAEAEDVVVAVDARGRAVVLDAASGEELRVLLNDVRVDDPAKNDIAVSPDGQTAFVVLPAEGGQSATHAEIVRVPVAGGASQVVVQGVNPAVSPDGSTLAYVSVEPVEGPGLPEPVLILRDLADDTERRLTRDDPYYAIGEVEWTADGSQLVFTTGEINKGLHAIAADAESLDEARRLGPEPTFAEPGEPVSWHAVAPLGQDRLAVAQTTGNHPDPREWQIIAVSLTDGAVTESPLIAGERLEAFRLDSDRDVQRLLILTSGGLDGGELLAWDGQGEPRRIAGGIIAAAW